MTTLIMRNYSIIHSIFAQLVLQETASHDSCDSPVRYYSHIHRDFLSLAPNRPAFLFQPAPSLQSGLNR